MPPSQSLSSIARSHQQKEKKRRASHKIGEIASKDAAIPSKKLWVAEFLNYWAYHHVDVCHFELSCFSLRQYSETEPSQ